MLTAVLILFLVAAGRWLRGQQRQTLTMTVIEAVTAVSAATIYVSSDAQWAQITKKFYYENFILGVESHQKF